MNLLISYLRLTFGLIEKYDENNYMRIDNEIFLMIYIFCLRKFEKNPLKQLMILNINFYEKYV